MSELSIKAPAINLAVFQTKQSISDEDKAKVREYAKLMKTQADLHKEIQKISKLMSFIDSKWCRDYMWVNQQGEVIPVFDIDDSYLKNIYNWSIRNKRKLNKQIFKEYISRFGVPEEIPNEEDKYSEKKYTRSGFHDWSEEDDWDF